MNFLHKADYALGKTLRFISVISLAGVFLMYLANVVIRFMPVINFTATDEIAELLSAWLVFFGAAELYREKKHFIVDMFVQNLEGKTLGKILQVIVIIISLIFFGVLFFYGMDLLARSTSVSTTLRIPKKVFYACVPISAGISAIYMIRDFVMLFVKTDKTKETL